MRYLGRKSELTQTLRSIGELPPEQRGPVGKAANEVRVALEQLLDQRTARARGGRARAAAWPRTAIDVTLPGDPPQPGRPPAPGLADAARDGGRLRRPRLQGRSRARRSSTTTTTSPRSTIPPEHPARAPQDTFYFSERRAAAHAHLADAGARDGGAGAADLHRGAGARVPARHATPPTRRCSTSSRAWPSTRTSRSADLQGVLLAFARAMFGEDREVRLRPATSRSPSRAWRWTSPASAAAAPATCRRLALTRSARARAGSRSSASGMVDPNVLGFVAENGYDPERVQGFAFGHGHRADRDARARGARPADAVRERPAPAGAVRR